MNIKCMGWFFISCFAPLGFAESVASTTPQNSRFRVTNQCTHTIWIQQDFKFHTQDPIVVKIEPGLSYDYQIPQQGLTSTRFWAKSGCNQYGYQCRVGESTAVPQAELNGWQKPPYAPDINSKFEATWGCANGLFSSHPELCASNPSAPGSTINNETWWNGSAVDGYTFPYLVHVKEHNNSCTDLHSGKTLSDPEVDCSGLSAQMCPSSTNLSTEGKYNIINGVDVTNVNLQWLDPQNNQPIGCFSPCAKLTTSQGSEGGATAGGWKDHLGGLTPVAKEAQMYCCPTPPVSSGQCSAGPASRSEYTLAVARQRCNSYTYAYDDAKGLSKCGAQTKFELVFCPKDQQDKSEVSMSFNVPVDEVLSYNQQIIKSGISYLIATGGVIANEQGMCTVSVSADQQVVLASGGLCKDLKVDNTLKQISYIKQPDAPKQQQSLQVNFNTSVGISAYVNEQYVNNAQVLTGNYVGSEITIRAIQQNKTATCLITYGATTLTKDQGVLCQRINLVLQGDEHLHIYLPAEIPDMNNGDDVLKHYIHFGMGPSVYAVFADRQFIPGEQIALDSLINNHIYTLTAYQSQNSASCDLVHGNNGFIKANIDGLLCKGLTISKLSNGDYHVAISDPIPTDNTNEHALKVVLGIAHGMKVSLGAQVVYWNSADKNINLNQGDNYLVITGNNQTVRQCRVTINNKALSIAKDQPCQGVVSSGNVLYFPYF